MQDFLLTNVRQRFSIDEVIFSHLVNFVRFVVESIDLQAVHGATGADQDISDFLLEFEEMATSIATNYITTARTSTVLNKQPGISKFLDRFGSDFSCKSLIPLMLSNA